MIELPAVRTTRTRYPEEVKALAYEVYAHRANGDMPEAIRLLGELTNPPVSEKTVYQWRADYQWDRRLQAEREAASPVLWEIYFGGLAVAAPEAVNYLRSVVQDTSANPRDRISASRALLSQVAVHLDQLEARAGGGASDPVPALDGMTDAELLAYQEKLRQGEE